MMPADDAHIEREQLESVVVNEQPPVFRASNDDKAKVPVGEPGEPVNTGVRPASMSGAMGSGSDDAV